MRSLFLALTCLTTASASASAPDDPPRAALADIGPAPGVQLIDQEGRPFDLESLRGKAVIVSFVYTTCGGVCPATTHKLSRVQDALRSEGLWGEKVRFVSISLDPKQDTPEVLKRYASVYDADTAAWSFLTGQPEDVSKVVSAWGMWARRNDQGVLDHPSRIFLVDPKGRIREIYSLEFLNPEVVVQDVKSVMER